mmetsp:Transcript_45437/g.116707  ORF Transcript_45437/g.116707 Transcript_45437/m.116707 type:complete len:247 (-) Transcript_45437:9-749(-)
MMEFRPVLHWGSPLRSLDAPRRLGVAAAGAQHPSQPPIACRAAPLAAPAATTERPAAAEDVQTAGAAGGSTSSSSSSSAPGQPSALPGPNRQQQPGAQAALALARRLQDEGLLQGASAVYRAVLKQDPGLEAARSGLELVQACLGEECAEVAVEDFIFDEDLECEISHSRSVAMRLAVVAEDGADGAALRRHRGSTGAGAGLLLSCSAVVTAGSRRGGLEAPAAPPLHCHRRAGWRPVGRRRRGLG